MDDRYVRFSDYLRKRFGCRVQKISVDAGFSCPNRDGTLSSGGCIYCDNRGFSPAARAAVRPLRTQIREGIDAARARKSGEKFMVYFQAYTNTYAPVAVLKERYDVIREFPEVVALAIGTRPDCVADEVLDLASSYADAYEVWMEYGVQSLQDRTLALINRGHTAAVTLEAIRRTRERGVLNVCAHLIVGLPGEGEAEYVATARALARSDIQGVKFHPLHVVRGTALEAWYRDGRYEALTCSDYARGVVTMLECLPPTVVIERLTADCPADLLVAPVWLAAKGSVIGAIEQRLVECNTWQGKLWSGAKE